MGPNASKHGTTIEELQGCATSGRRWLGTVAIRPSSPGYIEMAQPFQRRIRFDRRASIRRFGFTLCNIGLCGKGDCCTRFDSPADPFLVLLHGVFHPENPDRVFAHHRLNSMCKIPPRSRRFTAGPLSISSDPTDYR